MAVVSTYQQFSEIIQNELYGGIAPPGSDITQRHIGQMIATKIAKYATISAYANGNSGDTAYANDQFISVFYSQPLLTNSTTNEKYVVLPATPAGLPKNTEIDQVSFTGAPNIQCIPCLQKDTFMEQFFPSMPQSFQLYKIENGNIVFINLPSIINSPVNIKMIGAISTTGDFMSAILNLPKDLEDAIRNEILEELKNHREDEPRKIVANQG